ncbi:nucleotidyltransferase family protein [Cyanobacterium sp. IPPAS B-1200]|uniref:nucleotidyltransferase family protein n=1 Tax=Cyanobacterium sp. IPPAS B-1200 TaxID=1562720 RepID=UPI0008527561|nr:nucleotidyltransferase domain-containing protein [Cyanobacterium sp. IPPAS B-1200]OEJ78831.1 DNA polymerase subunit beta [Cyanobacterium sp. IPPAS B-1200]
MRKPINKSIYIPRKKIALFCQKWKIVEFAFFGSILREDFNINSDIDCLVKFSNEADWNLFDRVKMQRELELILGRKVDLINKKSIENSKNWLRKKEILGTKQIFYIQESFQEKKTTSNKQ